MAKLRPAFVKDGSVTAANASGINDGASFVLLASEEAVEKYNLTPLCEVVGIGQGGVDPLTMGLGPTPAIRNALKYADMKLDEVELVELNEAFAAQSLGVVHELVEEHGIDRSIPGKNECKRWSNRSGSPGWCVWKTVFWLHRFTK